MQTPGLEEARREQRLTVVDSHAVFLPAGPLVHSAGVGVWLLVGHGGPGEAAQVVVDQADVAPPAVVNGHVDDSVGVGAAHQPAVLAVLAVRSWSLVGGWELAVHPNIPLQVS